MSIASSCLVAFFGTVFCIWILMPVARKVGLVDKPGGRKVHRIDTPLIGGLAIFVGFCFALLTLNISLHAYRGLIAACGLILLVGIADDYTDMRAKVKLVMQIATVTLLCYSTHLSLDHLGTFWGITINTQAFGTPLAIFAIVGYVNAVNMLDGQDGLAGSVIIGQLCLLIFIAIHIETLNTAHILALVISAVIGFLIYNFPLPWRKHADIFMGDSGSMLLALLVAFFSIKISQAHMFDTHHNPIIMLWVLAYPILDLTAVSLHRIRVGQSPLRASRDHLHHIFHGLKMHTCLSTLILCAISLCMGVCGLLLSHFHMTSGSQLLLFLILGAAYVLITHYERKKLHGSNTTTN